MQRICRYRELGDLLDRMDARDTKLDSLLQGVDSSDSEKVISVAGTLPARKRLELVLAITAGNKAERQFLEDSVLIDRDEARCCALDRVVDGLNLK